LIGDNNYSNQLNDLRKQLDNWMEEINDLGHMPEKELAEMLTK